MYEISTYLPTYLLFLSYPLFLPIYPLTYLSIYSLYLPIFLTYLLFLPLLPTLPPLPSHPPSQLVSQPDKSINRIKSNHLAPHPGIRPCAPLPFIQSDRRGKERKEKGYGYLTLPFLAIYSFNQSFNHPSIQWFNHSINQPSIHPLIHSIHPFIPSINPIHPFIYSSIHPSIHPFYSSINHSINHSLIHSSTHSINPINPIHLNTPPQQLSLTPSLLI